MNVLLLLPIIVPLAGAALSLLAWRSAPVQRLIAVVSAMALFGVSLALLSAVWRTGIHAVQVGNWAAPFGITIVADLFSGIMLVLASLMGLAVVIYSLVTIDKDRESFGYYPLLNILMMGVCGAFVTGDIFNLYVWFEVLLIASFVLLVLGGERAQLEGGIKYVTLNLLASALFLTGVGILYGVAGTLNMADLAGKLNNTAHPGIVTTVAVLFLIAFGIKAAMFPLFFWLPASYHTPPAAVAAIFAGLLTKVGVYALIRVFTLLFVQDVGYTHTLILVASGLTMVTGVFGAVAQNDFRRILSFHIVSQIGYMIMGLALFTPLAVAGSIFYIIHHIVVKTNLFLISGIVQRLQGSNALKDLGGLYESRAGLAILFLIPALSLAGVPPLSGFFAKLSLIRAGLESEQYLIVAVAVFVGLLTLISMTKIWMEAFWKPAPDGQQQGPGPARIGTNHGVAMLPVTVLATLTVALGLAAEPALVLASEAARQLLEPTEYIRAVLGGEQ